MIKKLISVAMVASFAFVSVPVASASASESAVVVSKASDYSKKKKNKFWRVAVSLEPSVKYANKKDVFELGVLTCDLLRAGGDLEDLALIIYEVDAGGEEDFLIAIIASAPVVLCPDQQYKFN
jgi:hypothetical protein